MSQAVRDRLVSQVTDGDTLCGTLLGLVDVEYVCLANSVLESHAKAEETIGSEKRQANWKWLSRPHGSRNAAAGEDNAGEQSQLDAIRLLVGNAIATKSVQSTDRHTSSDTWD